jgi:hypothetical protein
MDNPWGSPWADDSVQEVETADAVRTVKPVLPDSNIPGPTVEGYPWLDDDEFGEWSENPAQVLPTARLSAEVYNVAAFDEHGLGNSGTFQGAGADDDDNQLKYSTALQTPSNVLPNLEVPPLRTGQLSPDPWAAESPLGEQLGNEDSAESPAAEEPSIVTGHLHDTVQGDDIQTQNAILSAEGGDAVGRTSSVSRPSSTPSDEGPHDTVVESPRTSFEEEKEYTEVVPDEPSTFAATLEACEEDSSDNKVRRAEKDVLAEVYDGRSDATSTDASINVAETGNDDESSSTTHTPITFQPDLSLLDELFQVSAAPPMPDVEALQDFNSMDVIHDSFATTEERRLWYRISRYGPMRQHNAGDDESFVRINWRESTIRRDTLKIVSRWREEDAGGAVILGGGGRPASLFGWGQKNAAPMSIAEALASKRAIQALQSPGVNTSGRASPILEIPPTSVCNSVDSIRSSKPAAPSTLSSPSSYFNWSTGTSMHKPQAPDNSLSDMSSLAPSETGFLGGIAPPPAPQPGNISAYPKPPLQPTADLELQHSRSAAQDLQDPERPAPSVLTTRDIALPVLADQAGVEEDDEWGEMVSTPALDARPTFAPVSSATTTNTVQTSEDIFDIKSATKSPISAAKNDHPLPSHLLGDLDDLTPEATHPRLPAATSTSESRGVYARQDDISSLDLSFFEQGAHDQPRLSHDISNALSFLDQPGPARSAECTNRTQTVSLPDSMDEGLVQNIISDLPDFSYMLR